jgi:branched-chain amino acid transport system substrate-binding protein
MRFLFRSLTVVALPLILATQCGPPTPSPPGGPRVQVAILSPMSGELAIYGESVRNGILMAFDEWNDLGGPNGLRLTWVLYDSGCAPAAAREAVNQALDDGIRLLVGPVCAEAAIPAAAAAQAAGALLISPTASHPLVTVDPNGQTRPLIFRAVYADPYQGEVMALFARQSLGAARAVVFVTPSDAYVRTVGESFLALFNAMGGQSLALRYDPASEDYGPLLAQAEKFGAQVLFVPERYPVVNRVAEQRTSFGLADVPLLGTDSWQSAGLDLAALDGSFFGVPFQRDVDDPFLEQWGERYKFVYAVEPDALAALGYEAGWLLAAAIDAAGTVRPQAVARALSAGSFEVLGRPLVLDAGHNPRRAVPILRVSDAATVFETFVVVPGP